MSPSSDKTPRTPTKPLGLLEDHQRSIAAETANSNSNNNNKLPPSPATALTSPPSLPSSSSPFSANATATTGKFEDVKEDSRQSENKNWFHAPLKMIGSCADSDPFIQAALIARYLQFHIFGEFDEASLQQYRKIDGDFAHPTLSQHCRPILIDHENNSCIIFSSNRTKKRRLSHPYTSELLMYRNEIFTAMVAAREVWLQQEEQGGVQEFNNNLRMWHVSVTANDVWLLQYSWTGVYYNEVRQMGLAEYYNEILLEGGGAQCVTSSFKRDAAPSREVEDWVRDFIELAMETRN